MPLSHETTVALLDGVEFLTPLSSDEIDTLADKVETVEWGAGTTIFLAGLLFGSLSLVFLLGPLRRASLTVPSVEAKIEPA